jgi:CO/xanthine dehydrogenase Mo-binding subunit
MVAPISASWPKFAVGQPVPRNEDPTLLRGQGRYTDDLNLPAQAYAVMVRSGYAHGVINGIDIADALQMPGVLGISPVLSTSRCTGSALDCGRATASVSARRLSVEWSGVARSRPSRRMMEAINPSVCRRARRNTTRSVSAVVIARAE